MRLTEICLPFTGSVLFLQNNVGGARLGKHRSTNSNDFALVAFKADPVHLCFHGAYGLVMWWLPRS